jgi:haloacetate dehalogenase
LVPKLFEGFSKMTVEADGLPIHLVRGGEGPPLLLLHGYPQNHVMWHKIAARLARRFTVVATDLRGYGDSGKPLSDSEHMPYSKRVMARDQVAVMARLGFESFFVAGHDRGARVAHRMALDHPKQVKKLAVLDIVPTRTVYETIDQNMGTAYFHWFFLIQPADFPERLIGADSDFYLRHILSSWSADPAAFDLAAVGEYIRCFRVADAIHASCEDYRAGATIDLEHDRKDGRRKVAVPLLALWGKKGVVGRSYDVLKLWKGAAEEARGKALPCGHFLAEEAPEETAAELEVFFSEIGVKPGKEAEVAKIR